MAKPAFFLLILALSLVMLSGCGATRAQAAFFQPCAVTQLGASGSGQTGDVTTTFGIGVDDLQSCNPFVSPHISPNQYNFDRLVTFTPPDWYIANDADVPDGTVIGSIGSKVTMGFFDNGCNVVLPASFDLFDATTNRSQKIDPGTDFDRLQTMGDNDHDGIPDAAMKWPSYLDTFAQRASIDLQHLKARYIGVNTTSVVGTTIVVNLLTFDPGSTLFGLTMDPALGYPTLVVVQDPTSNGSSKDPASDFCAPLWSQLTLSGEANSVTVRHNPPDGTYDFVTYVLPQPDEDLDGIENQLDPCGTVASDGLWDPRAAGTPVQGDNDGDGLPDQCDPHPADPSHCNSANGIAQADEDCDGWQNRGDNCPLVANADQADSDFDGLGDTCDPSDGAVRQATQICLVNQVTIGSGGPAPDDPQILTPCNGMPALPDGDVNCDDQVNTLDLLALLAYRAGLGPVDCPNSIPEVCDQPALAAFLEDVRLLMLHLVDSSNPLTNCPPPL